MGLAKAMILNAIKMQLSTAAEKTRTDDMELAMALCLDDLSNRLASESFRTSYELAVAANARSVTLSGNNQNLKYLFAVKYGTGDSQVVLSYQDPAVFLRENDNPAAAAGTPEMFTILSSSNGFPTIKFDRPSQTATTLTVYFWPEFTADNVGQARSSSAIVSGSLAYFHGVAGAGASYYASYKELLASMKGADRFMPKQEPYFDISAFDKETLSIRQTIRNRRA